MRRWLVLVAFFGLSLGVTSSIAAPSATELRAFLRAKQATDVLPAWVHVRSKVTDSRRIATYVDGRKRPASTYIVKTADGLLCHFTISTNRAGRHAGGGCSTQRLLFASGQHVAAGRGRLLAGVVANEVRHIVVVGSRGRRHPVRVTPDGGFIFDCRAWNGCACVVAAVEARDADNRLLSTQRWPIPASCRR